MTDWYSRAAHLMQHGLYDPANEHDACGVGLIAAIDGKPRRSVVEAGIDALKSVWHRGAVVADGKTGDGAGLHVQIPHAFFAHVLTRLGKPVPQEGLSPHNFAVGMVFLPKKNLGAQETCRTLVEAEVLAAGYRILGWRQVPVNAEVIGEIAADSRPEIEQLLLAPRPGIAEQRVETELFLIRKKIEKQAINRGISDFYICSLSARSVIYKGLFKAEQLTEFYPDLLDPRFESAFAIFHQRFSTNTAPAWHLAQPFRLIAHNGEINTLKGNVNHMKNHRTTLWCEDFVMPDVPGEAAQAAPHFAGAAVGNPTGAMPVASSPVHGPSDQDATKMSVLDPILPEHASDTAILDAAMEVLVRAGRPLPLAKLMLIPPAWNQAEEMPQLHKDFFGYYNCFSEPWDGPAAIAGTDGEWVIAGMDRNGLRPMRYSLTKDGLLLIGSESGMVPVEDSQVVEKGRLGPGAILGVHLPTGTLYRDAALKDLLAGEHPYGEWVKRVVSLDALPRATHAPVAFLAETLRKAQSSAGYTMEEIEQILHPMGETGKEAVGSMGDDTPLAVLSHQTRPFHHFFRQNFSQVTNPPIDSLRERRVMSLNTRFGNSRNMLATTPEHADVVLLSSPLLLADEFAALTHHFADKIGTLDVTFSATAPEGALQERLATLEAEAEALVRGGRPYVILSDDGVNGDRCAIPMILAASAVHQRLVKAGLRKTASIVVRTGECIDVHHFAVLIGVGVTAVHCWLAEATLAERHARGLFGAKTLAQVHANFREAMGQGLLKIMSKMGIAVVSSYRGGYNFEALGLSRALAARYFPGLSSRISGIGLDGIERRARAQHAHAWWEDNVTPLPIGGFYKYRAGGERHAYEGTMIHLLQTAVTRGSYQMFKQYSAMTREGAPVVLRDLLDFAPDRAPVPIDEVEPVTEIRKRFVAPAMSLGALSREAHETLAVAMNRMGANSNSGEGGEDPSRYKPYDNGDNANSTIKQVASARFGVTIEYLGSARELQIKVAQGAKPGEGGQLPGFKVTEEIARLRYATPGVTLISPPPHHDIYSIEDLAQLIYDLKQANPDAVVSVKLVSQSGIGTIASGVAKAMADKVLISGHSGGTGASPYSSVKFAGIPWEMGLAEANQVLTLNQMRHRVKLQADGGMKTGRDIVIAAMLGAEEFGIGTASLVAMGCIMVRQCHSNTCPVGVCTQDPKLREKFDGSPEKVIHLFSFIAEEVREILASLGFRSLDDVVGRADLLAQVSRGAEDLVDLDLNPLLAVADPGSHGRVFHIEGKRNEVPDSLDVRMLRDARGALERGERIQLAYTVRNTDRAVGTRLSAMVAKRFGHTPLQEGHVTISLRGSAGQSLGAFLAQGVKIEVLGDANDYVGKGLSGGLVTLRPRPSSQLVTNQNTIIGNTVLYGATGGALFAAGQAGERFAVRNSGATVVIEGCGSNGCEYMTGGMAVILGEVGDNFAAGMTGGMAFIYDASGTFERRVNPESVVWQRVAHPHWDDTLRALVERHVRETESTFAASLLAAWQWEREKFWQVCPKEMVSRLEVPLAA